MTRLCRISQSTVKLLGLHCDSHHSPPDGMTKTFAYRVLTSKVGQRYIEIEGFIHHIDF